MADTQPTVLVVEDIRLNMKVMGFMVEDLGYPVVTVRNGRSAVEAVKDSRFGLILMDLLLPVMDGYEATRAIRRLEEGTGRHTPIVAVTADAMPGTRGACIAAGMDGYISKPVILEELQALFTRWLPPLEDRSGSDVPTPPSALSACMRIYLSELPARLDSIRTAVRDGHIEELRVAAHTLSSTSALVGAATLAELCAELESAACAGTTEGLADLVARLGSEGRNAQALVEAALCPQRDGQDPVPMRKPTLRTVRT